MGIGDDDARRWTVQHGLAKEQGYASGIALGLALFQACKALGIEEVSVYGFTEDNTRRRKSR
jgi:undecaprenyl diphosphate synthase